MAGELQPWYTVHLNLAGCVYDVRVNDGPLYQNVKGFPLVVEIPVNRWLRSGANEISLHLRALPGKTVLGNDCRCSAAVYRRNKSEEREKRTEVARLEYPGPAPVRREGGDTIVSMPFGARLPFAMFRWFTSEEIVPGETTVAALTGELQRLHDLFAAKNLDAIAARFAVRDQEESASVYETLTEKVADTRQLYAQLFDDSKYSLRPLYVENARLRLFGGGRLARLEIPNGQSPLYYMTTDRQTAAYVEVIYCRGADGGWTVVR